jgi:aminopeptidase
MMTVDYEAMAEKMVKALGIREGEVVSVTGGLHTIDFLEILVLKLKCAGAYVIMETGSDSLTRRTALEVPMEFLQRPSPAGINKMEIIDCMISIGSSDDPLLLSDRPLERGQAMGRAGMPAMHIYNEKKRARKLRTLGMGFPTPRRAEHFNLSFEEYHDLFWRAVQIDLTAMREKQKSIAQILERNREIRILSEKGTDMSLSLEGRTILLDSGMFTTEDFDSGNMTTNWPCGEVWVAPVEHSGEGVVVFDTVFHQGRKITDLKLVFRNGKAVEHSAGENGELFAAMMSEAEGDRDMLGEFAIGTNPEVTCVTGDTLLDEKIVGTVHLALGSNRYFGGNNVSTLHKDMVILGPTLYAGGETVITEGKFCR